MKKSLLKKVALVLYCVFVLSLLTLVSSANQSVGDWGYYGPVHGFSYRMQNRVGVSGRTATAEMHVGPSGNQTIPVGNALMTARLYRDDTGVRVSSSSERENSAAIPPGTTRYMSTTHTRSNTPYYADGITGAFNGTDYWRYSGFRSPRRTTGS